MLVKFILFLYVCVVLYICLNIIGLCEIIVELELIIDYDLRFIIEVEIRDFIVIIVIIIWMISLSLLGGEVFGIIGSVILIIMLFGFFCFIKWSFVWSILVSIMMNNNGCFLIVGKMFLKFCINKGKLNIN